MMLPGKVLCRIARTMCSANAYARVVEPAIADLQTESQRGRGQHTWRRMAPVSAGYVAVWKVIAMCALMPERSIDERRALSRILRWTATVTVVVGVPLIVAPLASFPQSTVKRAFLVYLIPQALPLVLPAGVTFGVALGLSGMARSRQTARDVLRLALGVATLSFVIVGWLMPAANQAFRQAMFVEAGGRGVVSKGPSEMSFSELSREAASQEARGNSTSAREHRWRLHTHLALPGAALTLPAFLFLFSDTRMFLRGLVASVACFGYFVLMFASGSLAIRDETLSVLLAAWLPNLVFGGTTILLYRLGCRSGTAYA